MKRAIQGTLRRFGVEIRRVSVPTGPRSRTDPRERAEIDSLIDRFARTQPVGSDLADAAEWRRYLSDQRLAFFYDLIRVSQDLNLELDGKRIADVGSGTGYLLRLIAREAPAARLTGYDTFAEVMPLAETLCPNATFEARGLDELGDEFDVVFCTEVLEHLVAPDEALQHLSSLVPVGGTIVLTVPDGRRDQLEAGARREDGTAYWGHIHFWSPESWQLFIDRALPSSRRNVCGQLVTGENYAVIWK